VVGTAFICHPLNKLLELTTPMRLTDRSGGSLVSASILSFFFLSVHSFHPLSISQTAIFSFRYQSWPLIPQKGHIYPATSSSARPAINQSGDFREGAELPRKNMQQTPKSLISATIDTIGSTTSVLVAGTFYAFLCYQPDAFMVSFFVGAISNGILSKTLKKLLNQSRPAELDASMMELAPSDNGMPSSHAMSLGFICAFTALTLPVTTLPLILYALISLKYRLQTNLHSLDQIVVGTIVGSFNGALWWQFCTGSNNPFGINIVDWVNSSPVIDSRTGLLPWYFLSIPALVGAAVVGSVERRISKYVNKKRQTLGAKKR
jgi:hypothetical protein